METKERSTREAEPLNESRRQERATRSPAGLLTLIAFLVYGLTYVLAFLIVLLVEGIFFPPMIVFAAFLLLIGGLVATRFRWSALPGAIATLATLIFVYSQPEDVYVLQHPADPLFNVYILMIASGLVAIAAGVWATIENYRRASNERHLPRWSPFALTGLVGIMLGIGLVSVIVGSVPQAGGVVSASSHGEPTVHMTANQFAQNVVLVPKGSKLLIVDDGSVEHILQNGEWDASGTPHTVAEPGAPTLQHLTVTGGSVEIGPFAVAGVYHIYCTVHENMNLTIVVQ